MDKVKTVCLFAGLVKCWHEWKYDWRGLQTCSFCNKDRIFSSISNKWVNDNPDPLHNDGDYWRLVKGMMRHDGWIDFEKYSWGLYLRDAGNDARTGKFPPWLLLDPARFIDLIWQFTGQEGVQDSWGWVECSECFGLKKVEGSGGMNRVAVRCNTCDGTGKLKAPWLEEMEGNLEVKK